MEFLKNIKRCIKPYIISLKLFIDNYITRKRHNKCDDFMKLFIFRNKYEVSDITFERCIEGGQLLVICASTVYPDIDGYFIDSTETLENLIFDYKLPIYICSKCHKPISFYDGGYLTDIKLNEDHLFLLSEKSKTCINVNIYCQKCKF